TPPEISDRKWEATTTCIGTRLSTANSIVTADKNITSVMVANLTPRWTHIRCGQKLTYFDPFSSASSAQKPKEVDDTFANISQESPKPELKEGYKSSSYSIADKKLDAYIDKLRKTLQQQDPSYSLIQNSKAKIKFDTDVGEGDSGSLFSLSALSVFKNQSTDERPETFPNVSVYPLVKRTNFADFEPVDSQLSAVRAKERLEPITKTRDTTHNPGDWLSKLDLKSAELSVNQHNQLRQLLHQYSDIFSSKPGRTNVVKHHIDVGDSRPIKQGPYRLLNPERKAECTKQTAEMLNNDVAEPSFGPWASPVTLVPKKDGTLRFCIDFRKLNEVTVKDTYPIPRIDDTLDALKGAKYFSTLDLSSGFWQVELDEGSKEKAAFVTHEEVDVLDELRSSDLSDYELISEDDGAVLNPIHVERLKPYHEQSSLI
ncbi:unnamed protein product, partial [Didymodactylos carnosus]